MKSSDDTTPPAGHMTHPTMRSAMARASTRESPPPPNPTVHTSTPPPTGASYLTVAHTNINITPHQGGTPAPAINAPSPSTFAHPNYYEPINDDNPGKPPHGGDFPTSNKNSPSLLMPPSPRDGSNNTPPPPGASIQPAMTATFGNALPTPNPHVQEGSVARDGAPQPTNPDFLATILCAINAVRCDVSGCFNNLGDVNACFDALND
jgi:hypothetical protein